MSDTACKTSADILSGAALRQMWQREQSAERAGKTEHCGHVHGAARSAGATFRRGDEALKVVRRPEALAPSVSSGLETQSHVPVVLRYAEATIPTEYGSFRVFAYRESAASDLAPGHVAPEHLAIVQGDVEGASEVVCRVHSECLTGEVLHSLKCDCREQLDLALRRIAALERGVVLYMRQEGRGIGLGNKLRAYALQEEGYDTVDANRALGFEDDLRRYDAAAAMLKDLQVRSVALLTNNPAKLEGLRQEGIEVVERVEHDVAPNPHNVGYLETKKHRMGHLI